MKSRVLKAADFRSFDIQPYIRPFVPDGDALERELWRLTNPYVRWEPGERAEEGDLAVCRLASECPRFNRENVRFAVGSGVFHKKLETLTVGMRVGETRTLELPEGRVELTVQEVARRIVPEPDDEMVCALGLEGVASLEEYRAYLVEQQKEKFLEEAVYEPVRRLRERLLEESEFVIAKEDWRAAVERKLTRCRVLCRQEGLELEKMTAEQFNGRIPVKSYAELTAMLQEEEWDTLLLYLLGRHYAQEDGFAPGEADYAAYIADYVKSWRCTEEQAREIDPYESYLFSEYAWHTLDVLRRYVKEKF